MNDDDDGDGSDGDSDNFFPVPSAPHLLRVLPVLMAMMA
jgi:hypothetical protein